MFSRILIATKIFSNDAAFVPLATAGETLVLGKGVQPDDPPQLAAYILNRLFESSNSVGCHYGSSFVCDAFFTEVFSVHSARIDDRSTIKIF